MGHIDSLDTKKGRQREEPVEQMHVTHLDDQASPLAAFSAPPFRTEEWRNLGLAIGAPDPPI